MGREKNELDEQRRRVATPDARAAGEALDIRDVTTGPPQARTRRPGDGPHEEGTGAAQCGRPRWHAGDPAERERRGPVPPGPGPVYTHLERCGYTEQHEQVLLALTAAQERRHGDGVYLKEVAWASGLSPEEARTLLYDLTQVHRLVTELAGADQPDMGPRFEVKPRL
ncbi:hypothetical protein ABZ920_22085 [Streptomyces sp. NPDC046831]|uniref:hypothetical protein n=1 Tax=Streptomyces sp. NPDC046831 TaxID=3154805 RepID=UPI0034107241